MGRKNTRKLRSEFSLGGEQAEADPLLGAAFFESGDYAVISSSTDARCFLIGRTGGGKSAALQQLEQSRPEHVVRITPEDLSLTYITDLGAIRYLDSIDVHMDPLFIALWKHVLLVELIRHRYNVDSPAAKQNFLGSLRDRVKRDPSKQAALDYLDEFEGRFWCETDERVKEITRKFEEQVTAQAKGSAGVKPLQVEASLGSSASTSTETRAEQAARFQRIVNETQLPRLNKMMSVLDEDILDSDQHFTYVIIDDLDRDWVDERLANDLVRCLFRTVIDLKRVRNLKVLVALRTNIFEQLNFGTRTGAQEEKFRSLALRMRWTRQDLLSMLDARAVAAAEMWDAPDVTSVRDLLPQSNKTRGDPVEFILDRTLLRPRDAIAFVNEALSVALGKPRISWDDLRAAEQPYSYKRLLALRDEWKLTYPDIDRALEKFSRCSGAMPRDEFTARLDDVMLLLSDWEFAGQRWLTEASEPMWTGSGAQDWGDLYQPLTKLLFKIGFLGLSCPPQHHPVFAHDDPDFVERPSRLEEPCRFLVHPSYRAALDIASSR